MFVIYFTPYTLNLFLEEKMVRKCISLLTVLFLMTSLGFSASKGTSGAQFLKIVPAPRAAALGGAYTAIGGDIDSILFNPAGLSTLQKKEAVLVQNNWIQDISNQYVAFGLPTRKAGTFGLAVDMVNVKDINKYDNNAVAQGKYEASDMAVTLAYAKSLSRKLGIGVSVKSISSKIDDQSASALAGDVGAVYKASRKFDIGLSAQNIGGQIKYINEGDPLPLTIRLGGAYKPNNKMLFALDVNSPNDSDLYAAVGAEYCIPAGQKLVFPVRVGYRTGMEAGGLAGLGTGLGILYNKTFGVDLAWTPEGDLGDSMKFGIKFIF